jgi:hypothetical protein
MSSPTDTLPSSPPPPPASGSGRAAKSPPPLWPAEKFVNAIGRGPAAAKRLLDRLARVPGLNYFFALFTSVWFGILVLFLIGVYVGIGSGFASWRARFEMTDLEFFDAWPMRVLVVCLALDLAIVTIRKIPLTLFKLGVWTVHIGILTLLTGCVIYFSQKQEGSVRIFLHQTASDCFDVTERALYTYPIKADGTADTAAAVMTPLRGLPIYYEHIAERNNALDMPVASSALTGVNAKLKDASLKVVGYYPYAELENTWEPADAATDPATTKAGHHAVFLAFSASGATDGKWFVDSTPADRLYDIQQMPFAIEYLHNPSPEKMADITAEFNGPLGLTVRTGNVTRTFAAEEGKSVAIDGTPYTLTPGEQMPMPVISKGYEGTFSNILTVHVVRKDADKDFTFDRMVLARFPEISPDFIEVNGQRKRIQERVDHDIQLTFHDAQRDQFWLVQNDAKFELIHRKAGGGKVERIPLEIRKPVSVPVGRAVMGFNLMEQTDRAVETARPHIIPVQQRERGQTAMDAMQMSIVELSFTRGELKDKHFFVPFVQFATVGHPPMGREPTIINVPGVGPGGESVRIGFLLSTTKRPLPTTIKLVDFEAVKYPGASNSFRDYVSKLEATDKKTGKTQSLVARLNEPAASHGLYYFQSSWDGDRQPGVHFSVLGVGSRPGINVMLIGASLMVLGIGYAFYIKPILLNAKKKSLAPPPKQSP